MAETIQFVGLNDLEDPEKDKVNTLTTLYHDKIRRLFKNMTSLKIHIKQYEKSGHASKYAVNIKAIAPTKMFEVDKADWDLARVMHKAFKALQNEIKHHLRSEGSNGFLKNVLKKMARR